MKSDKIVSYEELCHVIETKYKDWNPPLGFDHERDKHMKVSAPWLPAFLSLLWLTGGRVSEVLAIRGKDIKIEEQEGLQVAEIRLMNLKQKGNYKRSQKVATTIVEEYPKCWEYIDKYHDLLYNPSGLLFPRSRKTAWYHCKRIFSAGTHNVGRHSWVMEKADKGHAILDAKQQGGWTSLNSMNAYIHEFSKKDIIARQIAQFKKASNKE